MRSGFQKSAFSKRNTTRRGHVPQSQHRRCGPAFLTALVARRRAGGSCDLAREPFADACKAGVRKLNGVSAHDVLRPATATVHARPAGRSGFAQGNCVKTADYVSINIGTVMLGQSARRQPNYFGLDIGRIPGSGSPPARKDGDLSQRHGADHGIRRQDVRRSLGCRNASRQPHPRHASAATRLTARRSRHVPLLTGTVVRVPSVTSCVTRSANCSTACRNGSGASFCTCARTASTAPAGERWCTFAVSKPIARSRWRSSPWP